MRLIRNMQMLGAAVVLVGLASLAAEAADPCDGYNWDVSKERALFAESAQPVVAGRSEASAAKLVPDRLYEVRFTPQSQVTFSVPPEKKLPPDGVFAGLAELRIATDGIYRISLDAPIWIDVVADGKVVGSRDFQGAHGCDAPRKIVEFELSATTQHLLLQFSGTTSASARVSISRAPTPKS